MDYNEFLRGKRFVYQPTGKTISIEDINPLLFDFQKDFVRQAVRRGRCAIFADTGMGKTFMLLEYARLMTNKKALVMAPLSVARQTVREARKFGTHVTYIRGMDEVTGNGIYITNYEMISHIDFSQFEVVVLDESSILKSIDGKIKKRLFECLKVVPYILCTTATPAPNDEAEIANHAHVLRVMTREEMLSIFFVHDEQEWRLRGHAHENYYQWLSSWATAIKKPSDLGYSDEGYILPPLTVNPVFVDTDIASEGKLFFTGLKGISDRSKVRKATIEDRLAAVKEIVNNADGQVIVWCGLNDEAKAVTRIIKGAVEISGDDDSEEKADRIEQFQDGKIRVLVTKPKIAGFGLNLQSCHNMVFFGLSDSWESYYQCVRRCWRFGQQLPVNVWIVLSEAERAIYENIMKKEAMANEMSQKLIENVRTFEQDELNGLQNETYQYKEKLANGKTFEARLGDACERMKEIVDNSIHLSVFSPPFEGLFVYSPTTRDLGNSRGKCEFFEHFKFIIRELLRVTKPGRNCCVHTADVAAMAFKDGFIGLKDFPGWTIQAFEECGWIYHGRVTIDKNPQAQAIRTHSKALLFVQMEKDSSWSRPAMGDYILIFRKPGENETPIRPVENGEMTRETWIEWARPIWTGINESDTLQYTTADDPDDERHICPLQLGVIERCVKLWSNPGEIVFSPFGGIGSEGYVAIKNGRQASLIELKESYFNILVRNLERAEMEKSELTLFDMLEADVMSAS